MGVTRYGQGESPQRGTDHMARHTGNPAIPGREFEIAQTRHSVVPKPEDDKTTHSQFCRRKERQTAKVSAVVRSNERGLLMHTKTEIDES